MNRKTNEVPLEVKNSIDGSFGWRGYVAAYGNVDSYGDVITKGAGAGNIGKKLYAMYEHQTVVGSIDVVGEDANGLIVEGKLMPDDNLPSELKGLGGRLRWLADNGVQLKMSIGYYATDATRNVPEQYKGASRLINKFELLEGSIVMFPANEAAVVTAVKSLTVDGLVGMTERDIEAALIDGRPMSQKLAKTIVSALKSIAEKPDETVYEAELKKLADEMRAVAQKISKTNH